VGAAVRLKADTPYPDPTYPDPTYVVSGFSRTLSRAPGTGCRHT
jgi:hypothetical protein